MPVTRAAHAEPIPGYHLIEPIGKGGYGEVWKCTAPGGLLKAVKIVPGRRELEGSDSNAEQELRAFELIRSIRHPFLLSIERVEVVNGDLVLVMELADRSLHDLLMEYRERGRPGLPRAEAVQYLHEAAEVLDLLNQEYGLKHLDIKPRNLFLVGSHLKVADFGLVGSLADLFPGSGSARRFAGGLTPLYAAPETFRGQVTLFSDQYSLAVTYHELVTGEPVFQARNYNLLAMMAVTEEPDLSRLDEADRPAVGRALSKDPRSRFATCVDFVNSLEDAIFAPITAAAETPRVKPASSTQTRLPAAQPRGSGFFRRRSRILPAVGVSSTASDPMAGFQLLESLGRGPTGELWRARGPGGGTFLVRYITLPEGDAAVDRLCSLRHPSLAATSAYPAGPGRTALVSEAGQVTLWDRFREAHASGQPGIPREELLGYLSKVAEALDELYHLHQLQHLILSPRQIGLSGNDPFLLDFAQAELLWMPQGVSPAKLNPRYSAPELFEGLVSDACDQHSLALIFQEMLVGVHPYRNLSPRQLANPKLRGQPDVSFLPGPDRQAVLKALSADPAQRYRSCAEMVQALSHAPMAGAVAPSSRLTPEPASNPQWKEALADLAAALGRGHIIHADSAVPYRLLPGVELECRAWARLAPGMARLKLAGFRDQWKAQMAEVGEGRAVFHIQAPPTFWDRCLGRTPALQVEVCFGPPFGEQGLSPIRITMLPVDCQKARAGDLLTDLGVKALVSLTTYLGLTGDRASQERFPLAQSAHLAASGREWQGMIRDVGPRGVCLRLSEPPPFGPVSVTLHRWGSHVTFNVPGQVVAVIPTEGAFEAEVVFS
jgi:serine/threonine protein kinase